MRADGLRPAKIQVLDEPVAKVASKPSGPSTSIRKRVMSMSVYFSLAAMAAARKACTQVRAPDDEFESFLYRQINNQTAWHSPHYMRQCPLLPFAPPSGKKRFVGALQCSRARF